MGAFDRFAEVAVGQVIKLGGGWRFWGWGGCLGGDVGIVLKEALQFFDASNFKFYEGVGFVFGYDAWGKPQKFCNFGFCPALEKMFDDLCFGADVGFAFASEVFADKFLIPVGKLLF